MLTITVHHRLFLARAPLDFRKGIEGIAAYCKQHLEADPYSGTIFIFSNRAKTSLKLLVYDGNGFWLCQKRFSAGKLKWWPKNTEQTLHITALDLQVLLAQGNPERVYTPQAWRRIT